MADFEKRGNIAAEYAQQITKQQEEGSFIVPTPEEKKRVIRKLDFRLLPIVFLLYSLAILDRSNLGNAKLAGMAEDIDLKGSKYNWLGTIFYISYILSQWTLLGWKQFPPHIFATCSIFSWASLATLQAAAYNWGGLIALRFFLGIAEATFASGVILYLSFFYPRAEVGFRQGVFVSGAAIASAYGGALGYAIGEIRHSIAPWKILFLIEGLPTLLVAAAAYFVLPDSISKARFLNDREKQVALHFTARQQRLDVGKEQGVRLQELWQAFEDPKSFLPVIIYFGCNVSYASLPLFLPTIISELGTFSEAKSNGVSAPPYVLAAIIVIVLCWLSDRCKARGPFVAFAAIISAVGFIINATTHGTAPRYASTFLSVWIFASVALVLTWVTNMHATESKRAGALTIMATLGQTGTILGTNIFPPHEAPLYRRGMWISVGMSLMVAVVAGILSLYIIWENKKMDREGGTSEQEVIDTDITEEQGYHLRHKCAW